MHSATLSDVLFLILCCNKVYVSNDDAETWWSMRKPKSPLRLLVLEAPPVSGQQQQTASTRTHMRTQRVSLKVIFFFAVVFLRDLETRWYFRYQIPVIAAESNPQHWHFSQSRGFTPITRGITINHSCVLQAMGIIKVVHSTSLPHAYLIPFSATNTKRFSYLAYFSACNIPDKHCFWDSFRKFSFVLLCRGRFRIPVKLRC